MEKTQGAKVRQSAPLIEAGDAQEMIPPVQTGRHLRSAAWALGIGFFGLFIWLSLAPLDEGVPAQGVVVIDTKRKPIQHLQGGIVRELLVREGTIVEEGQALATLEQAVARINMESARQHYFSLRASEGRLRAELEGKSSITTHPDLKQAANDLQVNQHLLANEQLFHARRNVLESNLSALQQSRLAAEAQLRGAEGMLRQKELQLDLVNGQLERLKPIVSDGFAPLVQQIDLERSVADLRYQIEDLKSNLQRYRNIAEELTFKMQALRQDHFKEASQELTEVHRELRTNQEKLTASSEDLQRTEIRSPVKGQVVGLASISAGSVVAPGQKLMDIVPENAELIIEARLQPQVIDRVGTGQIADIRFSAFSHSPLLIVEGRVESVSRDLITDPDAKLSYYLARVSITASGRKSLEKRELQAGLPAEVLIKTGARSMLSYIAYPMVRRLQRSMKEE
jgi:protease secretion system membrane fusion protein